MANSRKNCNDSVMTFKSQDGDMVWNIRKSDLLNANFLDIEMHKHLNVCATFERKTVLKFMNGETKIVNFYACVYNCRKANTYDVMVGDEYCTVESSDNADDWQSKVFPSEDDIKNIQVNR